MSDQLHDGSQDLYLCSAHELHVGIGLYVGLYLTHPRVRNMM